MMHPTPAPPVSSPAIADTSAGTDGTRPDAVVHVDTAPESLPLVLAGPMLRLCTASRLSIWLAATVDTRARISLHWRTADGERMDRHIEVADERQRIIDAGRHLRFILLDIRIDPALPLDTWIDYRLELATDTKGNTHWHDVTGPSSGLCHDDRTTPGFLLPSRVAAILHGSCRKPHFKGRDGLARADRWIGELLTGELLTGATAEPAAPGNTASAWPSALVLSGDQVYMDDVAGPMLRAIHTLIHRLGLPGETFPEPGVQGLPDAAALQQHPDGFYRREQLLPSKRRNRAVVDILFRGVEKPVFTTANASNHLITLGEMLGMYLLAFSPIAWTLTDLTPPANLTPQLLSRYERERDTMSGFIDDLPAVRRLLAHVPVAMIFDDHDITDDWNLSGEWEATAYGHPFSKRVIGNALLAYSIGQAWGNAPDTFSGAWFDDVQQALTRPGSAAHDAAIHRLLAFRQWHYTWPTEPPIMAIDSRSRRWRSSTHPGRPSGLLDWQGLTDLQQALRGRRAVLLVSPAPIFGVKLIESIQRVFSWWGLSLMVDAENWMAHRGSAYTVLNIFRHPDTPRNFVILSGDVHYSFVYDVAMRDDEGSAPAIWQICSSGVHNAFPTRLLACLDHLNRWLYSPRSPLNLLTRRRRMQVMPRKPVGTPDGRRLLNGSGIGLVELDADGRPWRIRELLANDETVAFVPREAESRWE